MAFNPSIPNPNWSPAHWLTLANERHPDRPDGVGEWLPGDIAPVRVGWYERCFSDGKFQMWWDGAMWRHTPEAAPHWRQVGDYPAWRGLVKEAPSDPYYWLLPFVGRESAERAYHHLRQSNVMTLWPAGKPTPAVG